jgi:hypothetical protein
LAQPIGFGATIMLEKSTSNLKTATTNMEKAPSQPQPNKPNSTKQIKNKAQNTTSKKACAHKNIQQQPKRKIQKTAPITQINQTPKQFQTSDKKKSCLNQQSLLPLKKPK